MNILKTYLVECFPPPPPTPRPKFKAQPKPMPNADKGKINRSLLTRMGKSWQTFFGKTEADMQVNRLGAHGRQAALDSLEVCI